MAIISRLPGPAWSREQQAFIEWLALPKEDRIPGTEGALAEELGVDRATLYRWRKLPELHEEVHRLCRSMMGARLAEVLASVEESAVMGSLSHQRLYFELLGMIGPRRETPKPPGGAVKVIMGVDLDRVGRSHLNPDTKSIPAQAE